MQCGVKMPDMVEQQLSSAPDFAGADAQSIEQRAADASQYFVDEAEDYEKAIGTRSQGLVFNARSYSYSYVALKNAAHVGKRLRSIGVIRYLQQKLTRQVSQVRPWPEQHLWLDLQPERCQNRSISATGRRQQIAEVLKRRFRRVDRAFWHLLFGAVPPCADREKDEAIPVSSLE